QLRKILGPIKQTVKNVEFQTTLLADVFIELVKIAISIQETSVLYNNQFCYNRLTTNYIFRLSVKCLKIMAQMYSYLVENTKSELNYIDPNICQKDFLLVFNKIIISIKDDTNLFSKEDLFSFLKELIMKKDTEEFLEELDNLVEENSTSLEVE
ncbi:23801_t:CDS:2, partial [Cetraspora pellucida]